MKFVELDCTDQQNATFARELGFKSYPSVRVYPYSKINKEADIKAIFDKETPVEAIIKEVSDSFDDDSVALGA